MYLSSFALIEPEDRFYFFQPTWLNAWEAFMYKLALKSTRKTGWGLKRFGTDGSIYHSEMIRNPQYIKYLDAMEQAADVALQALSTKERMKLFKSRTAFIYADSWGETGLLENITSPLHVSMLDTLPKNLVKKFSISDVTCKIRGEKYAFMQAMSMAQDYLNWDVFDHVVVCCAHRAIPILVLSDGIARTWNKQLQQDNSVNLTVERVGCFIFSRQQSAIKVNMGRYITDNSADISPLIAENIDTIAFAGVAEKRPPAVIEHKVIQLADIYGDSGCVTPALSFEHLQQHPAGDEKIRTIVPDNFSGYYYFDIEYSSRMMTTL